MKQIRGYQTLNYFHRVGHMFLLYLTHIFDQLDSTTQFLQFLTQNSWYEVHPTIYVSHYVNYSNSFWKNIGIFTTTSGHSSILMCRMRFVFQKFQNQMLTLSAWSLKFTCSHGNGWSCPNLCVCQSAEYGSVFDFT